MKKLVLLILILVLVTGCIRTSNYIVKDEKVEANYATYEIKGLVEIEELKDTDIHAYCLKEDLEKENPDKVILRKIINDYTLSNNLAFKNFIPKNLYNIYGENIHITGNTIIKNKNKIVYKYIVEKKEDNKKITTYYIVGNYKYIYVKVENNSENSNLDKAVYNLVKTFKWE